MKYVAIRGVNEKGEPLFCRNPLDYTTEIQRAFAWNTKEEAEKTIQASEQLFKTEAIIVEVVEKVNVINGEIEQDKKA